MEWQKPTFDGTELEMGLPRFLVNDMIALSEGYKNHSPALDCLYCEVQGSINSAYHNNEITEEQADFLRLKYLGIDVNDMGQP